MLQSGTVLGGVLVSSAASDRIQPLAVAVQNRLSVGQLARILTVYLSLAGSIGPMPTRWLLPTRPTSSRAPAL